jgi:hypothetical protein
LAVAVVEEEEEEEGGEARRFLAGKTRDSSKANKKMREPFNGSCQESTKSVKFGFVEVDEGRRDKEEKGENFLDFLRWCCRREMQEVEFKERKVPLHT